MSTSFLDPPMVLLVKWLHGASKFISLPRCLKRHKYLDLPFVCKICAELHLAKNLPKGTLPETNIVPKNDAESPSSESPWNHKGWFTGAVRCENVSFFREGIYLWPKIYPTIEPTNNSSSFDLPLRCGCRPETCQFGVPTVEGVGYHEILGMPKKSLDLILKPNS